MISRRAIRATCALAILALAAVPAAAVDASHPGLIDKEPFLRLVEPEDVTVEIWLPKSILKLACAFDEELADLCGGLELLQALVIEFDDADAVERLTRAVSETEGKLMKKSWVRIARIREEDSQVSVLVLNEDETMLGLAVLVVDTSDRQLVFANVAGTLDMAKLQQLGRSMDIPGLRDLEIDDDKDD